MDESFDPIDRLPEVQQHARVNPADRSNPEKKDNGFSNALKEKMKEKMKDGGAGKDEVVLQNAPDESSEEEEDEDDQGDENEPQPEMESVQPVENEEESTPEHIDLTA